MAKKKSHVVGDDEPVEDDEPVGSKGRRYCDGCNKLKVVRRYMDIDEESGEYKHTMDMCEDCCRMFVGDLEEVSLEWPLTFDD